MRNKKFRKLIDIIVTSFFLLFSWPSLAFASDGSSNVSTLIFWVIFFGIATILIAGVTDKVVIFYDTSDLYLSFAPWLLVTIFGFMASTFNNHFIQNVILLIFVYIIPGILVLTSVYNSICYNKSVFIGLIVGPFKLLLALLGIVTFINSIISWLDDDISFKKSIIATIIFSITGWITAKLINGESVYVKKGWSLPEKHAEA